MSSETTIQLSGADKQWGFPFGCDGLMSRAASAQFLGVSTRTIDRLCDEGRLRKGRHPGGVGIGICRRSITLYLEQMEI